MVEQPDFKPGRHPYHHAGVFYSQEPSASSAAPLLGVKPGMRVLDLCAAPGGKSSQLAAALQGQGLLVSNEYVAARAEISRREGRHQPPRKCAGGDGEGAAGVFEESGVRFSFARQKRTRKAPATSEAREARERGCSPLSDPKGVVETEKS